MNQWTKEKINKTVKEIRQNGILYYGFGYNTPLELKYLDEFAFGKRSDLILSISPNDDDRIIKDTELNLLEKLENVRKLHLNNFCNGSLSNFRNDNLIALELTPFQKTLDLKFIENFVQLTKLTIRGKTENNDAISNCINLEYLYLSTTIRKYDFIKSIDTLKTIFIDSCISSSDFSLLNKPSLEEISITSIKNLETIDSIKDFKNLKKLRLDASRIKLLPEMHNLLNLKHLELNYMKIWENPEIIKTIPKLEKIELHEINTKLKAEQFYFMIEMETLKEIDYRFMDFNKKRIEKLNKWFEENHKGNIVIK